MTFAGRFCNFGGRRRVRVADLPLMMRPTISSYRGDRWKSTKTVLASIVIVCFIAPLAFGAAQPTPSTHPSVDMLPPHALDSSPSLYLREAASSAIRWHDGVRIHL